MPSTDTPVSNAEMRDAILSVTEAVRTVKGCHIHELDAELPRLILDLNHLCTLRPARKSEALSARKADVVASASRTVAEAQERMKRLAA